VVETEKTLTNADDPNSSTVTETFHQKEKTIIENTNDPVSTVTHQLEQVHVTVETEPSTSVTQENGLLLY